MRSSRTATGEVNVFHIFSGPRKQRDRSKNICETYVNLYLFVWYVYIYIVDIDILCNMCNRCNFVE